MAIKPADLARVIDHTLLKPDATPDDIQSLCNQAMEHGFHTACVNPSHISHAKRCLEGSPVKVCSVSGFPLGASLSSTKAQEAKAGIEAGADEIDMVLNVGALKAGDTSRVRDDIAAVADVCRDSGALCKVIFECCLLTDDEKLIACNLCKDICVDFVKTSTGLSTGGATVQDVRILSQAVAPKIGVKASGGIASYKQALELLEAGATRLGTSRSIQIMKEALLENG